MDDRPTVLISTHEKAEALLRFIGPMLMKRISCVVIDEAHSVVFNGNYESLEQAQDRSLQLESLVNRLKTFCDEKTRFIALSAVAAGFRDKLAAWVGGSQEAQPIVTDYRSTRQLLGRLTCNPRGGMTIQYDVLDGQRLTVDNREESPYIRSPFPPVPTAPKTFKPTDSFNIQMRAHLLWAAMHLTSSEGSGNKSVLISIAEHIEWYAGTFLDLLTKDWIAVDLPPFFTEPTEGRNFEAFNRCKASCADYFGQASREYKLLEHGVVLHHGKMPHIMARLVIELIRDRVINIVLATSTLSEGVNLPIETVLIPSLTRGKEVRGKHKIAPIPPSELANLIGRAGRPGVATEGKALVLLPDVTQETDASGAYWKLVNFMVSGTAEPSGGLQSPLYALVIRIFARWKRITMSESVEDFVSWLEQASLTDNKNTDDDLVYALDTLDQHLLNVLEENDSAEVPLETEEIIGRFWQMALAKHEVPETSSTVMRFLARRGRSLKVHIYPDRRLRKSLYNTGLPPRDGLALIDQLSTIKQVLLEAAGYASWDRTARIDHFHRVCSECCVINSFAIPDFKPSRAVATPWIRLFEWWMDPSTAEQGPSPKSVTRWYDFASKHFIFKLNWALGSVIGSILERDGGEGDVLERWERSGLPWAVMWYKDMISWGTLDPVASYVLSRKAAFTRHDAADVAAEYWGTRTEIIDTDLKPPIVSDWMDNRQGWPEVESFDFWMPASPMEAILTDDFSGYTGKPLRVLPATSEGQLRWFDPAGYELARSTVPTGWRNQQAYDHDFFLNVREGVVTSSPYNLG